MTLTVSCSGLEVPPAVRDTLARDDVAARLAGGDPTLFGSGAGAGDLGWLALPERSRDLVGRIAALRDELRAEGLDRVVLCGTGGSALPAEAICRTAGVPLTVVDTTDPGQVALALADLERTVVVVGSRSGDTLETDTLHRVFVASFRAAGVPERDIGGRFVVVTAPGSPLAEAAEELAARALFPADPRIGGRWSALSASGLVPAGLAGVDVGGLLDEAAELGGRLAAPDNPALELGAVLGAAFLAGRDKLALVDGAVEGGPAGGLACWVEHLLAQSTGKEGRGLLPVVLESAVAPGAAGPDAALAVVGGAPAGPGPSLGVAGPLGAQFLGWEYATAVAARLLEVDPFDDPDTAEPVRNARRVLDEGLPDDPPLATIGAVQLWATGGLLDQVDLSQHDGLSLALDALLAAVPERGYLAVAAYLDRDRDTAAAQLRSAFAARTDRAVTFGWGPRYLHCTGQYQKGGPPLGTFLQVTGVVGEDLPVPDRPWSLGDLQAAQAAGDRRALADRGRPVLRLHLTDRSAGVAQVLEAVC
ncbi:glucose-6-phosphate isomerase [Geodermatophilus marinus]|uniref:glucose-6-phosphate isomerase n=1 Tax=Geodermatophilus sp. LHW52908 TaxID=2303986 RepID=UPI000E3C798D|nr:glucose-6-phosphate isomerase [Geodermatophilus sp. LHW52908]RFU19378.1 glucose-6-phosphate isomerase [Geodermatophilus sp. LHW52908]